MMSPWFLADGQISLAGSYRELYLFSWILTLNLETSCAVQVLYIKSSPRQHTISYT